ncbi:MAG: hypothetical protein K2I96_11125, partial [Lachnospiraceae bacterium]|nr:hypothetical protein [Lachnospiraceae bacterium]
MDTKTPENAPRIPGSRPYKTAGAASLVPKEKGMSCLWVALAFLPGLAADHRLSEKQIEYYLSGSRKEHGICCALFSFWKFLQILTIAVIRIMCYGKLRKGSININKNDK